MTEIIRVSPFLRFALLADAATCLPYALLLTFGSELLHEWTNLPASLFLYAGFVIFPFVALLLYAQSKKSLSKNIVWLIIGINLLWTIDSFLLLVSGYVSPNSIGYAFVIAQAIGVLIVAAVEFAALRQAEVVIFKDAKETI